MGIAPDSSPYGGQTVTGPGWPNVDEETLAAAAASYEALASTISGNVVPEQQGQLMQLSDSWEGVGAVAAAGEATTIIGGHEANAAQAAAIAAKLRAMEATVVKTKMLANTIAQEVQHECEGIAAMPFPNAQELVQSRIKMGLSQNIANVTTNTTELANTLGVPPSIPLFGAPPVPGAKEAQDSGEEAAKQAGDGSQQAMQMAGQMGAMAAQLPMQIGQSLMAVPQQLGQQLSQPLQQLTSMFGQGGKADSLGAAGLPFSSFSNHPLAGGSGAGGGSGMVRAASLPGSGGAPLQTPQMANLVGSKPVSTAPAPEGATAGAAAVGGAAPMAAGGGMGGMAPMMGQRGASGGTAPGLAVPAPLEHDLDDDDDDDW
ncbi:hypothetical protein AU184_13120 [Mycolicibacterium novocastrense]|uniref:hypothetical protein n=1 Tax=Mycolicibacterium novocastrense TaxID=59813 RepID=UPI000747BE10|nr:hypothetical protein [Mycolicibacterium novocastrense]KUH76717.1 hypothetical protein AU183_05850 [Mycolicibacterium novocastrense]KUH77955.1 hypothetical protein AU072_08200 [Mycolicibacterium novocastrense]KUH79288.1 hypothetical protein AU184_13120 [Mycolicibacterium novocastrense]